MHSYLLLQLFVACAVSVATIWYLYRAFGDDAWSLGALFVQLRLDFNVVILPFRRFGWWLDGIKKSHRKKKLEILRERLRERVEKLTRLEEVMAELDPNISIGDLVHFANQLDAKHWERLNAKLFLDPRQDSGLSVWLRRHTDRDVVRDCWCFAPQFADLPTVTKELHHRLTSQQNLWRKQRDSLRRDCMQHQVVIEEFEASLGIKEPDAEPEASDKRSRLKRLRVRVAEMRLEEERLEHEILNEEDKGAPGPHRRKAHISTDTD